MTRPLWVRDDTALTKQRFAELPDGHVLALRRAAIAVGVVYLVLVGLLVRVLVAKTVMGL